MSTPAVCPPADMPRPDFFDTILLFNHKPLSPPGTPLSPVSTTMVTPAETRAAGSLSRSSSYSSIDSEYFYKTYVPLTNLPTPPLSSHSNLGSSNRDEVRYEVFSHGEILDPELLGPAIHLVNLIPSATSLTPPSVSLVQAILTRADLPLEILAFAVCVLDSLNSRFALSWRQGCPLEHISPPLQPLQPQPPQALPPSPEISSSPPAYFPPSSSTQTRQHIDTIHPELLVLCALVLGAKFLDDNVRNTVEYVDYWGYGIWSYEQIEFTQRCVLENLGYRLLVMWEKDIIDGALEDMRRAGKVNHPSVSRPIDTKALDNGEDIKVMGMSMGKAILGHGQQLTPAETPLCENSRGTKDVGTEIKTAFSSHVSPAELAELILPGTSAELHEPFPGLFDLMSGESVMF